MRVINLVFALLINAVPLYGVKYRGWSAGTILVLYWFENLLTAVFTTARITLHRALTRKRGHWRRNLLSLKVDGNTVRAPLLYEYAGFAFVFTLAHGLFVGVFIFVIAADHSDWTTLHFSVEQFRAGAWQILSVMSAEFVVDAVQIQSRSFAWIKAYAQARMGRVLIMHLTILVGIMALAASDSQYAVLYALIGLKTLWSLAAAGASATAASVPANPPAWLARTADAVARDRGGSAGMTAEWQRERERAQREAVEDEEIRLPGSESTVRSGPTPT